MPNRPVEDILRKRLSQYPTPLDTDALWAEVEPRLPSKRSALPYWAWVITGLVLASSLYLFLPQQPESQPQAVATPAPVVVDNVPQTYFVPASAPKNDKAPTLVTKAGAKVTTTPDGVIAERPASKAKPPAPNSPPKTHPATEAHNAEPVTTENKVVADSWIKQSAAARVRRSTPTAAPFLPTKEGYVEVASLFNRITFSLPQVVVPVVDSTRPAPKEENERIAVREARRADLALANNEKPDNFRKKQPAYWTVEPGVAISLSSRSVNTAGDNPDGSQVNVNEAYEKALEAVTLQGLAGYHLPNGFSLRTGVTYNRINSKVASEFTTTGTESVETVVAIIENQDGSRRQQTGTVQVATEITTTEQYYNSVSSTDIPVLIGYRLGGTKWGLTVEAGPTFNLSSTGSAHLYDGAGNYRPVSGEHFRNKLSGRGFLANFGGEYKLSEKTMLTANLRVQGFGKEGFEAPSVGYATQYTLFGVQLGYRVRF